MLIRRPTITHTNINLGASLLFANSSILIFPCSFSVYGNLKSHRCLTSHIRIWYTHHIELITDFKLSLFFCLSKRKVTKRKGPARTLRVSALLTALPPTCPDLRRAVRALLPAPPSYTFLTWIKSATYYSGQSLKSSLSS